MYVSVWHSLFKLFMLNYYIDDTCSLLTMIFEAKRLLIRMLFISIYHLIALAEIFKKNFI